MQEQAPRRRGGTGCGTAACGKNVRNLFEREMTASNIDHGSHQVAHHMVQKSIAADAVDEKLSGVSLALLPGRGEDGLFLVSEEGIGFGSAVREVRVGCGKAL